MSGARSHCGWVAMHERGGEIAHVGGDRDLAHQLADAEHLAAGHHPSGAIARARWCGR